jgi:hypothetical protein
LRYVTVYFLYCKSEHKRSAHVKIYQTSSIFMLDQKSKIRINIIKYDELILEHLFTGGIIWQWVIFDNFDNGPLNKYKKKL